MEYRSYAIKTGDTLWEIANDMARVWKPFWKVNPNLTLR